MSRRARAIPYGASHMSKVRGAGVNGCHYIVQFLIIPFARFPRVAAASANDSAVKFSTPSSARRVETR